jgi:hypothetical protein
VLAASSGMFVAGMPLGLQIVLIVVPSVVIVLAGREVLRRRLSAEELDHAEHAVPFLLGTVGGFFGLLSGFMLSNAWSELSTLRNTMSAEVNALADMADIAAQLPQPQAGELNAAVITYFRAIVEDELPSMRRHRSSPAATRARVGLWRPLAQFDPKTAWDGTLRGIAINKVMEVGERRRQRLAFFRNRSPSRIWWILLMNGVVVVAGATIASLRYKRPAVVFLGALVVVVAVVLFSIHIMEHPFQYDLATKAPEYWENWKVLGGARR